MIIPLHILFGLMLIAFGFPLSCGVVTPNRWYGLRTASTLADSAIWYEANRTAGRAMVAGGAVIAAGAAIVACAQRFVVASLRVEWWCLAILFAVIAGMTVHCFRSLERLRQQHGHQDKIV